MTSLTRKKNTPFRLFRLKQFAREFNNFFLVINSSSNFIIYMRGGDEFLNTFCKICQKTLPVCCFRFLFRCVMRSEEYPGGKMESKTYSTKKKMAAAATFASTTNISTVSVTSGVQDGAGAESGPAPNGASDGRGGGGGGESL